jgi:tetratricopeptide (TPR) repeat protein
MSENPTTTSPVPEATEIDGQEEVTFKYVAGPAVTTTPYQAPDLPPYFVPRAELLAIKRLLLARPVGSLAPLTIHGPSGSGKTALAAAVAHDADVLKTFPDGVLWVSLTEDDDGQHAQAIWGKALGNDLSHLPDPNSRAVALRTLLLEARCLLIIDDVTSVEQVKTLNVGGPNCVRLITTDKVDEITYAFKTRRYALNRMSETEALNLLTEWAGILPDIYLPTVKEIIKRLCYSPLALALVGGQARQGIAWMRLLEILRDDQGPIATLNTEDPEVRRNGLGLVVNLVLSRFGGAQLQRSALLGAFAAGAGAPFSAEAAAACWQMSVEEARKALDTLVEAALIQRIPKGMYAVHRALRDHLRRAATPNALVEAGQRIREYYLSLVEQSSIYADAIAAQLSQIMAAFRYASTHDQGMANLFADALLSYFEGRGLWANLVTLASASVEAARKDDDVMREHAYLADLGYAYTVLGKLDDARACFERSLEISKKLDDPGGEATALNNIGAIYERQGKYVEAQEHYERSLAIRQRLGVLEDIAEALNNVAGVLYLQKRFDEALTAFQRVLDMYTVLNDRRRQAQVLLNVGAVYESLNNESEALQTYQRSLAIYANLNDDAGQAQALNNMGIIYFDQGDSERALAHFKRSLALKEKLNDRPGQASTLNNIALLYEKTGAVTLALEHYERSYQILEALEDPRAELVQKNIETLRAEMKK